MEYSHFLFSKLYSLNFPEDDELEYDLLFDKLGELYEDYVNSDFNSSYTDEHSCMVNYFLDLRSKYINEQHK